MKILITSGTGKIGRELTKRILAHGDEPVVMTHSLENLKNLPQGVEGIFADFGRKETWHETLRGIEKVCLITPLIEDEAILGSDFAKLACSSGIEQIVLVSIHRVEAASHIPHFASKIEMEETIKKTKIPYTFIRANNFFQNDELFFATMMSEGKYIQPLGRLGLNRVDVRDVADAIAHALYASKHYFRTYNLVGAETLTGPQTAAIYSKNLGQKVAYPENSLEIWEKKLVPLIPEWQREDLKMMYEFFLAEGLVANSYDIESTKEILETAPRKFEIYVKELKDRNSTIAFDPPTFSI